MPLYPSLVRWFLLALLLGAWPALADKAMSATKLSPTPSVDAAPLTMESPPRWILIGGGYDPVSNQISISQDLELARSLFGGSGVALFAGGESSPVAVYADEEKESELELLLEELLGDPQALSIEFRDSGWIPDGPSTAPHALDILERALTMGDEDLLVYAAGHGIDGESPELCGLSLWGGWSLLAEDLGELLDEPSVSRPLHLVLTSCFGGGFAHIAVHGGVEPAHDDQLTLASVTIPSSARRPHGEEARPVHCGLFAAPWTDESSGCDPDPDRRSQESYGIHFLHALARQDRYGEALPLEALDLDADGSISLLEAHTRARIESRSIDLPTTTSEHWLRLQFDSQPPGADYDLELLPEEQAVVANLGAALGVTSALHARSSLRDLDQRFDELATLTEEAQLDVDDAYGALRITLLENWPELSRAWSSTTRDLIDREHDAILGLATKSGPAQRYQQAMSHWERRAGLLDKLRLQRALVARVARSWDTLALAHALQMQAGPAWDHYLDLLQCERWAPALAN